MFEEDWLVHNILYGSRKDKRKAISYLYKNCFPGLKGWIMQSGTQEEAEDIFQEGLARLYDSLFHDKFNFNSKLTTYLSAICKNLWLMELRRNKVIFDSKMITDSVELSNPSVSDEQLTPLLNELGPNCRSILVAYYYENKPMNEIMSEFNLGSDQAARNKKYRCLQKLIKLIEVKGLTYESFVK